MNTTARYSCINCPSCGKLFRFLDTFESRGPLGQLLRCPKCNYMFSFRVDRSFDIISHSSEDTEQIPINFTADLNDKDAFNRFINKFKTESEKLSITNEKHG